MPYMAAWRDAVVVRGKAREHSPEERGEGNSSGKVPAGGRRAAAAQQDPLRKDPEKQLVR